MTKEQYIDEVITLVSRVDKTRRAHPRLVEAAFNGAMNTYICSVYEANPMDVALYTKTYENVPLDGSKIYLTSDYTSSGEAIRLVPLPRIGGGLMNLRASESEDDDSSLDVMFFPMAIHTFVENRRMERFNYTLDVGYVLRGNEITLTEVPNGLESVDVDVVRSFDAYDYEEEVYLPMGKDEEIKRIVLQSLGIVAPVNLKNNNSDESSNSQ
jgi:hypothetical protein